MLSILSAKPALKGLSSGYTGDSTVSILLVDLWSWSRFIVEVNTKRDCLDITTIHLTNLLYY